MGKRKNTISPKGTALRRGWTTGACATAATKSALSALLERGFLDPVEITLPGGQTPSFALANEQAGGDFAQASIIKDAGDDPDVTHGAEIIVRLAHGKTGSGVTFVAGPGVGTVTKAGLPIKVGEPAINPVPRQMMAQVITELTHELGRSPDFIVTISVPNGEDMAKKTWNPRLGIIGGISILGTTGIVIPYSCSAWIHSIHSGIDVARAQGLTHLVGCTGDRSEQSARTFLKLPDDAYIDMGDFVGGLLKYLRKNPTKNITIAGGFAKISKLAQGAMDLHSGRSQVDLEWLTNMLEDAGANQITLSKARAAISGNEILQLALTVDINLAQKIAIKAREQARKILKQDEIGVSVLVIDRGGQIIGNSNIEN